MKRILILTAAILFGASVARAENCTLINSYIAANGVTRGVYTCTGVKNYYDLDEPITWWDQVLKVFGL